ncbi:MAG: DUF4357 domain-containing protein [Deltaproteobacteria bacterium]|nr:DUF4357 domain-containing protein [Deltaproteobacteria bacterium]
MIIQGKVKYISAPFESEAELEAVVIENFELIFGPDSIFLPKTLIRSSEGFGTIPDGFAVDLSQRRWYIVEAELSTHSVWSHIAPQIAKQIIAASQPASRRILIESVVNQVKDDSSLRERFEEQGIPDIDIRQFLTEIFESKPIVGLPIDNVGRDLSEWARTLNTEVKLWPVKKLVQFGQPENVIYEIPDEFKPALDTTQDSEPQHGYTYYDVTLGDLLQARFLNPDEKLLMSYKPRNGQRRNYKGTLLSDGSMKALGETFTSPSYAALFCIQDAGSDRTTVNGWTSWKTKDGQRLSEIRDEFLEASEEHDMAKAG